MYGLATSNSGFNIVAWLAVNLTISVEQRPSWKPKRFWASQEILPPPSHSMEPEGSFSHSQLPAICPYSEADQSTPFPHIQLSEDSF